MQNKVNNIVASYEVCKRLHDLGVTNDTVFHYFKNGDNYEADQLEEYKENTVPAYTYEELVILIGHKFAISTLPQPKHEEQEKHYPPALQMFEVYFPNSLKNYDKGTDGNADILLYLIERKHTTVEEVNKRFKTKYRL